MKENECDEYSEALDEPENSDSGSPPKDVLDGAGWNRYWEGEVNRRCSAFNDLFLRPESLIKAMKKRGLQTVLCAGNGVSVEPDILAYAGFRVTATDLSTWAMDFCQRKRLQQKYLKQQLNGSGLRPVFPRSVSSIGRRLRWFLPQIYKEVLNPLKGRGGTLAFCAGNILDPALCSGPFDVVIERRMVQLFDENERAEILEKLAARLNPTGFFVSQCHLGWWRPGMSREHPCKKWFQEHGFALQETAGSKRVALLSVTTG